MKILIVLSVITTVALKFVTGELDTNEKCPNFLNVPQLFEFDDIFGKWYTLLHVIHYSKTGLDPRVVCTTVKINETENEMKSPKTNKTIAVNFLFQYWRNTEFDPKKSQIYNESSTMEVDISKKGFYFNNTAKAHVMLVNGNQTLWTFCDTSTLYSLLLGRDRFFNATQLLKESMDILENKTRLNVFKFQQQCVGVRIFSHSKVVLVSTISFIVNAALRRNY